jgi:hypothetical protein
MHEAHKNDCDRSAAYRSGDRVSVSYVNFVEQKKAHGYLQKAKAAGTGNNFSLKLKYAQDLF